MNGKTADLLRRQTRPLCLVLGITSSIGLSIIRSLGRKGIAVVGVDKEGNQPGSFSRYVSAVELFGSEAELEILLSQMAHASKFRNVFLGTSDEFMLFIDRHKQELDRHYRVPLSLRLPVSEFVDKRMMLKLAREAGLDVPVTFDSRELSINEITRGITFPCFIKPYITQREMPDKGAFVSSGDELDAVLRQVRFREGCLVQEVVEGAESRIWVYSGYVHGAMKAGFTGHKIRQIPRDFGEATVAVSKRNTEIMRLGDRFLDNLGYHGFFDIEFKQDRAGTYRFLEANMRLAVWNQLAVSAGIDLPYIAYADLTGNPVADCPQQKDEVCWTSILNDYITCVKFYRGDNPFVVGDWLKRALLSPSHAFFDVRDIGPFIAGIKQRRPFKPNVRPRNDPDNDAE